MTDAVAEKSKSVLIRFSHGLGDCVQLTVVIQHLQRRHPDWEITVEVTDSGKASIFADWPGVRAIWRETDEKPPYDHRFDLDWHEASAEEFSGSPSTKAELCLRSVFQIEPDAALCKYLIPSSAGVDAAVDGYLKSICGQDAKDGRFPVVAIHYEGNTSTERKNLSHETVSILCAQLRSIGLVPLILDWDRRSPLPDGSTIHCADADHPIWKATGTGDAATIAKLISRCQLFVGIDSGPQKVAAATGTPALCVWIRMHPIHYCGLSENALHLVPWDHRKLAAGSVASDYFAENYKFREYAQLAMELPAVAEHLINGRDVDVLANKQFLKQLHARGYDASYYDEHKIAGLDYLEFGDWQRQYGRWLVDSLGWRGFRMLDVGCACGSILRGCVEAGVLGSGVDVCEPMIDKGRGKWPDMASRLHICDAVNLHLFRDGEFQAIHSAQVAEHWNPDLVPFIFRELARVTAPGGLFFCSFDTEELFARQGRSIEHEDPTHICIKPMAWWLDQLSPAGWELCSDEFRNAMQAHPESFLSRYDWDWFVARRISSRDP